MAPERPPNPVYRDGTFAIPGGEAPVRLDRALRELFPGLSWEKARSLVGTGKVQLDGEAVTEPGREVARGATIEIRSATPRPGTPRRLSSSAIVHLDADVVVVAKPAGVSTVPYDDGETGTLDQLVRAHLNRGRQRRTTAEIGVVQRLDKDTTGLVVFCLNLAAKRHLQQQFRAHSVERQYLAIAQGSVVSRTISTRLVADRGDGRRGSTHLPRAGRNATTHVRTLEAFGVATYIECRLETGRTHQIRIHLAECGHPLLGERVYGISALAGAMTVPRIQLHAATLGFVHPRTGSRVSFSAELPDDMRQVLERLRSG